jgi:acetyl-CoA synthetase
MIIYQGDFMNHAALYHPPSALSANAAISSMPDYQALCDEANRDYEGFWARLARENIEWRTPFTQILDESNAPFYRWFADGTLNASYNCLDRHVSAGRGDKIALRYESDAGEVRLISYAQLLARVCKMANALKSCGVVKGDRVMIYMPMSVEGIVAMQACARIGAIHSVVFGGFSAKALHDRILDVGAVMVITSDEQMRGGKNLPLKATVNDALAYGGCEAIHTVLVNRRTGAVLPANAVDVALEPLLEDQSDVCEPAWVEAEHPLFILYTSGSTGAPKGIVHSTGGYMMWATQTMKWTFDIKQSDVFWCTADIGWITGHTYVCYGPLSAGATQIVFEGIPTYPDSGRFWRMVEQHQCTIFYTAPTAIRALIKAAEMAPIAHPNQSDLSSLRILGSVGEPINPEAWQWYHKNIGGAQCPIADTFWQTETGGHVIAPMPGATPLTPGSCTLPLPGIQAAIVDDVSGQDVEAGIGGVLVIKRPWPAMLRTIWGNPERYQKGYYPAELGGTYYLAGDGAICHPDTGYFQITGRIDDVLNISGHRMGTAEIESAFVSHSLVAEAAIVGKPDEITGESICAFVVLKRSLPEGDEAVQIAAELRAWVRKEIGPIATPKEIRFGDNLPKTRSGKIMRRLLRVLAKNEAITQDVSTLENPAILEQLKRSC